MKKLLFFFGTALFACTANAQETYWGKCNNTMLHLMKTHKQQARSAESKLLQRILVETTDASAIKQVVEAAGYNTLTIDESVIMVYIPLSYVPTLAAMEEVKHLASDSKADAKMELTHKLIGSDDVHKGVDLETPYTGKGVVVGVIDMGFQFQHASFLDENGKPRVHSVWNRVTKSEATTVIPKDGEIDDTAGHGTHVTSIAAGSHIESINVSGVAPEATIIMIPSDGFADNEVIEDIKYIKETAEALNMPHVINMSFGSHVGPHDGSTIHDYTLNKFSKSGSILVCAASNDGNDNIHTEHVFTADGEVRYVFFKDATAGFNRVEIWDQTADGKKHITVAGRDDSKADVDSYEAERTDIKVGVHDEETAGLVTLEKPSEFRQSYRREGILPVFPQQKRQRHEQSGILGHDGSHRHPGEAHAVIMQSADGKSQGENYAHQNIHSIDSQISNHRTDTILHTNEPALEGHQSESRRSRPYSYEEVL
jgi:hypothetical protein